MNTPRMCYRGADRLIAPCMDCGDRAVGCHGTCEKYKEYNEKNKEDYQKRFKAYSGEVLAETYEVRAKLRTMKRQGKRK